MKDGHFVRHAVSAYRELQANTPELNGHGPWQHLYKTLYWFSLRLRLEECFERALCGALVQEHLVHALIGIFPEDRKTVFCGSQTWDETEALDWGRNFTGAMAVARVARVLCMQDVTPILPTPEIDMTYKIDLIGRWPSPEHPLLIMQIKRVKYPLASQVVFLQEDAVVANDAPFGHRYALDGMKKFSDRHYAPSTPVMAQVAAAQGVAPWEFDYPASELHKALGPIF
jgi:hypothetical protein